MNAALIASYRADRGARVRLSGTYHGCYRHRGATGDVCRECLVELVNEACDAIRRKALEDIDAECGVNYATEGAGVPS